MDGLKAERHQIERLRSVAHLFPRSKGRQGLYALDFANDDRYVGQAVDVVSRLTAHRRRWPDIVSMEFARVKKRADLNDLEQRWIHFEIARGRTLRNIRHALGPVDAETDLDLQVSRVDQLAWLNDNTWLPDAGVRVESPGQRAKAQPRYERLRTSPLFEEVVRGLRAYVTECIPRPRSTELTFWAVSASPSTNRSHYPRLAAVSINSMETLVLGHELGDPGQLWGFLNVGDAAAGFPGGERAFLKRHPEVDLADTYYEASGPDVVQIQFNSVDQLLTLLADQKSPIRNAARDLNLRAMRKGPTLQWRAHCPGLADHLV